jgi:Arm DNA-binding domain
MATRINTVIFDGFVQDLKTRYRQSTQRATMALTDTEVRNAKPADKAYKLTDAQGMFLLVAATGSKLWRMDYRFAEKRKTLALGIYPAVSLLKARQRRDKARELLADGIDPGEAKKEAAQAKAAETANTFELVAREFHATQLEKWSPSHANKWLCMFER